MAVTHEMNLFELIERFGDNDKCRQYLEALRFPDDVYCIRCKSDKISRIYERNQFMCDACKYQFSATAGTIFHDTHLPLTKWFAAIYLICESKKGISANQMKRTIKVAYKTAWYLCHRIREAVKTVEDDRLSGTVEVDETYIGGLLENMHADKRRKVKAEKGPHGGKMVTLGALQRDGKVRLKALTKAGLRVSRYDLHLFIRSVLARDAKKVYTDDNSAYDGIDQSGVIHGKVNHSKKQYVLGDIHTNGIENVFSLLKRSIAGSFHHVSEKHLDRYLDELEHRFNGRDNPYLFRDTVLKLIESGNIEYNDLIEKPRKRTKKEKN
jgi:transposase-like protein